MLPPSCCRQAAATAAKLPVTAELPLPPLRCRCGGRGSVAARLLPPQPGKGKGKGEGEGEGKVKAKEEREGEGKGKIEGRVNICQLIQLKRNININWIKTLLEQYDPINF